MTDNVDRKLKMTFALMLSVIAVGLYLFFSSYASEVVDYTDNPTSEKAMQIALETEDALESLFENKSEVKKFAGYAMNTMYRESHFEALEKITDYVSPTDTLQMSMARKNFGDTAWHLVQAGHGYMRLSFPYDAYKSYSRAALENSKYAHQVIELLQFYGCTDETFIWEELGANFYSALSGIPTHGARYPRQVRTISNEEIAQGRRNLVLGIPPKLTESCPISLYKNDLVKDKGE